MPYTMNGIGTNYWGKTKVAEVYATCDHCGVENALTSYDTMHCFVVLYIPIIPLGRKRVLDFCSNCSLHNVMPLKKWEAHKREIVEEASLSFKQNPNNIEDAAHLIGTLIGVRDDELYTAAARHVEKLQSHSADTMNLLGVGHNIYRNLEEAERCFLAAITAENRSESREMLAVNLIRQTRADEATPYLQHILTEANEEGYPILAYAVQGLQAQGKHREALALLDQMAEVFPHLDQTPDILKLRKASQKHEISGKKVGEKAFRRNRAKPKGSGRLMGCLPYATIPAALLFFLFMTVMESMDMSVELVNGLNEPYEVVIQSKTYHLDPFEHEVIKVAEGEIPIKMTHPIAGVQETTVTINRPILTRLFDSRTHVLNPDRCALLYWEQAIYRVEPVEGEAGDYKLHTGSPHYVFNGLDYPFKEFPEEVSLSSSSSMATKERLELIQPKSSLDAINIVSSLNSQQKLPFLRNYLKYHAKDDLALGVYIFSENPSQARTFLSAYLSKRPLLINWHRSYQTLLENKELPFLLETYRALLEKEPENKSLQYLLARIEPDRATAVALHLKAASQPDPSNYAMNALAYIFLCEGNFKDGLRWSQKIESPSSAMSYTRNELMLAMGHYQLLLEENAAIMEKGPTDPENIFQRIRLLKKQDPTADTSAVIDQFMELAAKEEWEGLAMWQAAFSAEAAYAAGDLNLYLTLGAEIAEDFKLTLAKSKFQEAMTEAEESQNAFRLLAVALRAFQEEKDDLGQQAMDKALTILAEGSYSNRTLRSCLLGETPPQKALELNILPGDKTLAMLAMARVAPTQRAVFHEMAKTLNYNNDYPYLTVKRLLKGK